MQAAANIDILNLVSSRPCDQLDIPHNTDIIEVIYISMDAISRSDCAPIWPSQIRRPTSWRTASHGT